MRTKTSLRRLTALLLCLVMLAQTVVVASAATFSPKTETPEPTAADAFEFSNGEITDYVGSDTDVVIPAAIGGVTVTKIGQGAFLGKAIENVVIPSTVTYVDDYAFDYCDSLAGLYFYGELPDNLSNATYDMSTDVVIYCKGENYSDYSYEMEDYFSVSPTISNSLADPAYPAAPSHNWKYTDNGDGTHNAVCQDADCTEAITNVAHDFSKGDCVCGAKVDGSLSSMFSFSVADGKATITGYNATGLGGEITLPSTYTDENGTYPVTAVAARAFNGSNGSTATTDTTALSRITKITVPASITTVGDFAFYSVGKYSYPNPQYNVTAIVFEGDNVTFGSGVFGKNPNLTTVTLPSGMTEITSSMFADDTALAEITVPAGVTAVGARAFNGCTALKKVTFLGETAPTMALYDGYNGGYPFQGCTGLVLSVPAASLEAYKTAWADMLSADAAKAGDITLADGSGSVAYIPDFKVADKNNSSRYLEFRVLSFDNAAKTGTVELKYVGWNSSTATLEIPETVTAKVLGEDYTFTVVGIGKEAINEYQISQYSSSKYNFTQVTFPKTLTYIRDWGCNGLQAVTEIDLSGTQVNEIGQEAFRGCKKLTTVKLPATLTKLGVSKTVSAGNDESGEITITSDENIFACCDALENIYVAKGNPSFKDIDGILYSADGKKLIRYPNARPAASFAIPEGVEVIASQAFMQSYTGDSKLEKVTFPSTLKEIESLAFRQSSLTEVTLPAGVKFGNCAFDICKKLEKVTISEGVTELSDYMFWSDEAITEIKLPSTLKKIGDDCFGNCTKLASVALNQVEEIGSYAFYYTALTELTIPSTANTIGRGAFGVCQALEKVTFQEGCKTVAPFMFTSNIKLADLTLADSIETIGEYAFNMCVALTEVTMPKSLSEMGDAVFYHCWQSLKKVVFPDEVQIDTLPANTFESCQNLTYLYLGKNITKTAPVSLFDTNSALVVDCAVAESCFKRSPFDVYAWDLDDKDMIAGYEKVDEDDNGYPIYKVQLTEAGTSGGGCGGGAPSDGYYYFYAGAAPTFKHGGYEPIVLTVTGLNAKGEAVTKTYTKAQLVALAATDTVGYQYWRKGVENLVVTTQYVTIVDLLTDAGIDFSKGDSITAADKTGFAAKLTYENMNALKYYFTDEENKEEVPAALALTWDSGAKTLEELAASAYDSGSIRFCYGVGETEYGTAAGKRLVSGVVTLDVAYCQHSGGTATCTKQAVCQVCGDAYGDLDPDNHTWDNGVITLLPTTKKEGIKTFTCAACKATRTEPVAKLADSETDQSAANNVINLINGIGTVDRNSAGAIRDARNAYDALTPEQKKLVSADVLETLTKAEAAYARLVSSGSSGKPGTAATDKKQVKSGSTGDAGIAVYVGLSLLSLTGGAWITKKNRKVR